MQTTAINCVGAQQDQREVTEGTVVVRVGNPPLSANCATQKESVLGETGISMEPFSQLALKPKLFEPSETHLWLDPYISTQMLDAHLDPTTDAASRRPNTIDAEVAWLVSQLGLCQGDRVLDLGCGPGLYCTRLARVGLDVTGIDYSQNSIAYARHIAEEQSLSITYRVQDYLTLEEQNSFRAILLIQLPMARHCSRGGVTRKRRARKERRTDDGTRRRRDHHQTSGRGRRNGA